jgi:hypothetical protein
MDRWSAPTVAITYRARLRGGPDDGCDMEVAALPGGEPPDFFAADDEDSGTYVLAGLPNLDGSMPYWWIPASTGLSGQVDEAAATWTLISLGDDGTTRLWHQHGEDAEPVPLDVEPVDSAAVPVHIGRAYSCRVCQDMTVLSRPAGESGAGDEAPIEAEQKRLN